ncbi:glycosyltransferase [Microbulbifer thermotolerans]|uniref:glycosyltransferase n=1 Tax=Microbulbifer thermotolerans TaxID=252514 RepID=UPI00224A650B|nr:glycosyltransferase [Microbulbifer thermotolerans]MCX2784427.1 glycosyltransferase [Microbulbifer thermotolerans]
MKILFCTMQFGPGYNQGTEKYIRNLAHELSTQGCNVVVAGGDPENLLSGGGSNFDANVSHITLPTFGWSTVCGNSIDSYIKLLSELKPNVVHMANPAHIGINILHASRKLGIPYFISVTDFWWLCPKHTLTLKSRDFCQGFQSPRKCMQCVAETHPNRFIRSAAQHTLIRNGIAELLSLKNIYANSSRDWLDRKQKLATALRNAEKVICLSKTGKMFIDSYFSIENSQYIPAGLSDTWFSLRKPIENRKGAFAVGFLGAVAPHKGLHTLCYALQQLNIVDIELRIAGKLADRRYAQKCLMHYPRTHYVGQLNEQQSRDFIDDLDLLVIPSNSPENQPQVLLEAGARRKPTIASNIPGCAELLPKSALFQVDNIDELKVLLIKAKQDISLIGLPKPGVSTKEISTQILTEYQKALKKQ